MIGEGRRGSGEERRGVRWIRRNEEEVRKWGERGERAECLLTYVQTKLYMLLEQ